MDSEGGFPTTKHIDNNLHCGIHVLTKRQMSECISVSKAQKSLFWQLSSKENLCFEAYD